MRAQLNMILNPEKYKQWQAKRDLIISLLTHLMKQDTGLIIQIYMHL